MTDRSKTVVMLIDWDNLQICHSRDAPGTELDLYALIALAQSYGTLVSARAYAEWNLATERLAVYKAGIEPVFAPVMRPEGSLREGKSLADTVMVAEGVDLLWTVAPDVVVLVTSDKDMIPLARIAKQRGAAVVVLGSDLTAIPLVEMSNVFITYRQLLRELDRVTELDAPSGRAPARERRVLREARRPGGEPYGSGQERRGQGGFQGGMRAVAAPAPAVSAMTSAPAPSVPVAPPPRREEPDRPAAFAPVSPVGDADTAGDDAASASGESVARRRRRRGGRGRGRTGEFAAGDDRLQEIEAALMAGLPLDRPLPAESAEVLAESPAAVGEPLAVVDEPASHAPASHESAAASTSAEAPAAAAPALRSRRRTSQPAPPPRSTFGQVRRGVAFSEFGAPTTPPAPDVASAAEPNDAGVGPVGQPVVDVTTLAGAPSAEESASAEASAPVALDVPAEPSTLSLSLVPSVTSPEDEASGDPTASVGGTDGQAASTEAGPATEATDTPEAPVAIGATVDMVETGGSSTEAETGDAPPAAEPAPKPVRRRRTRRPPTTPAPAADVANG